MNIPKIYLPSQTYTIGNESFEFSRPVHPVSLASFSIMESAVSNAFYVRFVKAGAYAEERYWSAIGWTWRKSRKVTLPAFWSEPLFNAPEQPLVGISWYEALAFANWLSQETGENWHLPSEAQWEVAAQGGGKGHIHTAASGIGKTIAVAGMGYQSASGAWNMLGNVWEWCSTRWGHNWQSLDYPYPYLADDGREDLTGSAARVMRGGSWFDAPQDSHPSQRARYLAGSRGSNIGFRLVLTED